MRDPATPTDELVASAKAAIKALGDHAGHYDIAALYHLLALSDDVDRAALDTIVGLRARDYSWEQIGAAIGRTKQAAIMRWSRFVSTGDVMQREHAYRREGATTVEGPHEVTPHTNTEESTTMAPPTLPDINERPYLVALGSLREADTILCPKDGLSETVTAVQPRKSHVNVWTNRSHKHFRPKSEEVTRTGRSAGSDAQRQSR